MKKTFTGIVNREYEKFKLNFLTEDESHSEIRTRLLSKLEHDKDLTIQSLRNDATIF